MHARACEYLDSSSTTTLYEQHERLRPSLFQREDGPQVVSEQEVVRPEAADGSQLVASRGNSCSTFQDSNGLHMPEGGTELQGPIGAERHLARDLAEGGVRLRGVDRFRPRDGENHLRF